MIHQYVGNSNSGDHWAVGSNSIKPEVLVQLQENGEQVRLSLTVEQAEAMADRLRAHAERARSLSSARNAR